MIILVVALAGLAQNAMDRVIRANVLALQDMMVDASVNEIINESGLLFLFIKVL